MCGWHRASLKSICVPVRGHKRPALHESSSPSVGGFTAFFPLSHFSLTPLCAALHSFLPNRFSLTSYYAEQFFSFSPSSQIYINSTPSILHSPAPSRNSDSPVSLLSLPSSPPLVFQGVNGKHCKHERSLAAYHLEIKPSLCQCLHGKK